MLRQLTLDEISQHIQNDPVRPHISAEFRNSNGRQVWGLFEDQYAVAHEPRQDPLAVICVAYTNAIPTNEMELDWFSSASGTGAVDTDTAVFYTVWSYDPGAGRALVNQLAEQIKQEQVQIKRWVTLSPLTQMAERFHTRNGAIKRSTHDTCQVFDYTQQITEATA